jgi:hypothetical protein
MTEEEDLEILRELDLIPPSFSFPVQLFDHLHHQQSPDVPSFPRIPFWLPHAFRESGRVFPTESLLFSLIQELILTQQPELGDFLFSVSDRLFDHLIHFPIWFSFVQEAAFLYPQLLVYVLGILRPSLFVNEPDDHFHDILSLLIGSLMCSEVIQSPKLYRILSVIELFLNYRDSIPINDTITAAFENATPAQLIEFESIFPLVQSALELFEYILARFICKFLNQQYDLEIGFELKNALKEQFKAEPNSEKSFCLLNLIGKLAIVKMKMMKLSQEKKEWLQEQLRFEIEVPFGEGMLLKERLVVTRHLIEQISEVVEMQ